MISSENLPILQQSGPPPWPQAAVVGLEDYVERLLCWISISTSAKPLSSPYIPLGRNRGPARFLPWASEAGGDALNNVVLKSTTNTCTATATKPKLTLAMVSWLSTMARRAEMPSINGQSSFRKFVMIGSWWVLGFLILGQ